MPVLPFAAALSTLSITLAGADVEPQAGMLRWPAVSAEHIAFVYANDIWVAPRTGGTAMPLASPRGQESYPRFSPDGTSIAFVGNYDGNRDLYTVDVGGGVPVRVTHHPAGETLSQWMPDGRLLYMTNGLAGLSRQQQLFSVDAGGGMPEQMPVPYGGFGAVSPDGEWLAYSPHSTDTRTWKRYRGGMATDLWLFNLKDKSSRKMTDWEGTDTIPMWVPGGKGEVVYYLSDAGPEHRLNVWSVEVKSGEREQVTKFADWDVRWPSIGPGPRGRGEIVFQLGSELRLLDLGTKKDAVVKITVPGDRPAVRPHAVDAGETIRGSNISPSGKRVVIEARGDVWSAPAKEGVVLNLTRTDGVYERSPAWSPDGKWIAYFSDEPGEYELFVRPSGARPKEKEKKEGEEEKAEKEAEPRPSALLTEEPRKLTTLGPGFRYQPTWSPNSKHLAFADNGGVLRLVGIDGGEVKVIDTDPWSDPITPSWSSDSAWLAYARQDEGNSTPCIWLYRVKDGTKTRVTSPMFASTAPTFDRKGDYLFFRSSRTIQSPQYSDLDTTFIYPGTEALYLVPLRADLPSPWAPKNDAEELAGDEKGDKKDEKKKDKPGEDAKADDGVSGTWEGTARSDAETFPREGVKFTLTLSLEDGKVTGSVASAMGDSTISEGTFDTETGEVRLVFTINEGPVTLTGTLKDGEGSGAWQAVDTQGEWSARRSAPGGGDDKEDTNDDKRKPKPVEIHLEGFEARAVRVPVPTGNFGTLGVTGDDKLIYVRRAPPGGGDSGIKVFDLKDEGREEKAVTNAGGFDLSADGKRLLVQRGRSLVVFEAAAGGGKSTTVPTEGMRAVIDPRREWKQILMDVYRLQRDFFYEPTMHGVDWAGLRDHYMKMLDDAANREDVGYIIAEYISELNVGHAYLQGLGDVEESPESVPVGMLGCDFELVEGDEGDAYRIARIISGAPWDADARGPLSQPGVDVKEGEFLLAVNGVPVDTGKDPWAALVQTAGRPVMITVGPEPTLEGARDVLVEPLGSETALRYRDWIERKRAYVEEKSGGKIGYIYVPNTGRDGQSDLFRQFYGQRGTQALIIDERWNGGGQIPTRFIELLNRAPTNFWARRHGNDWPWPPDAHFGPKCMLINGLAGSGGDMFPWLFKQSKIGPVIGTRTWGGLVGISGNPGLIDGGSISVPTFGFYEVDGTWGVEGHGVDPDIEVIDDPAKMVDGGDPQLDRAIAEMLKAIVNSPFVPPKRPASPDRKGMGLPDADK